VSPPAFPATAASAALVIVRPRMYSPVVFTELRTSMEYGDQQQNSGREYQAEGTPTRNRTGAGKRDGELLGIFNSMDLVLASGRRDFPPWSAAAAKWVLVPGSFPGSLPDLLSHSGQGERSGRDQQELRNPNRGNEPRRKGCPDDAPSEAPAATMANNRSPCSLYRDRWQRTRTDATIIRLKMPTQRKNTTATGAPARVRP